MILVGKEAMFCGEACGDSHGIPAQQIVDSHPVDGGGSSRRSGCGRRVSGHCGFHPPGKRPWLVVMIEERFVFHAERLRCAKTSRPAASQLSVMRDL